LKLWNDGFMPELKQLPGLLSQEKESISGYLEILFRMYFTPKESLNVEANSKKLFELCSRVLKDYCLQQSELNSIMNSKREGGRGGSVIEEEEEEEGEKSPKLSNLHENELEK